MEERIMKLDPKILDRNAIHTKIMDVLKSKPEKIKDLVYNDRLIIHPLMFYSRLSEKDKREFISYINYRQDIIFDPDFLKSQLEDMFAYIDFFKYFYEMNSVRYRTFLCRVLETLSDNNIKMLYELVLNNIPQSKKQLYLLNTSEPVKIESKKTEYQPTLKRSTLKFSRKSRKKRVSKKKTNKRKNKNKNIL